MKDFFRPLGIFVMGNIGLLFLMLFFPAIGEVQTQLQSDTAAAASSFWGWTWVVFSIKLTVFLVFEATILFFVAKAFLGLRRG